MESAYLSTALNVNEETSENSLHIAFKTAVARADENSSEITSPPHSDSSNPKLEVNSSENKEQQSPKPEPSEGQTAKIDSNSNKDLDHRIDKEDISKDPIVTEGEVQHKGDQLETSTADNIRYEHGLDTRIEIQKISERPKQNGNSEAQDDYVKEPKNACRVQLQSKNEEGSTNHFSENGEPDTIEKQNTVGLGILSDKTFETMKAHKASLYTSVIPVENDHDHTIHQSEQVIREKFLSDSMRYDFPQQDPILTSMNAKDHRTQSIQEDNRKLPEKNTSSCNCTLI